MACQAKQSMIDDIAKRAVKQLRIDNPNMKGPELKAKSIEAATKIVEKASDLATQEVFSAKEMTSAIRDNASQAIPLPKAKQPTIVVSKEVAALDKQFTDNPSNENYAKLLNAEIAHGYRNAKGESLVRLIKAKAVGSVSDVFLSSGDLAIKDMTFDAYDGDFRNYGDKLKGLLYKAINVDITKSSKFILDQISTGLTNLNYGKYSYDLSKDKETDYIILGTVDEKAIRAKLSKEFTNTNPDMSVADGEYYSQPLADSIIGQLSANIKSTEIHELIHAGAVRFMINNPEDARTVRIQELFDEVKDQLPEDLVEGDVVPTQKWKENIHEFLAEALSNPKLIHQLMLIPTAPKSKFTTVLDMIVNAVLSMLNLSPKVQDNVHEYVMDAFVSILDEEGKLTANIEALKRTEDMVTAGNKRSGKNFEVGTKSKDAQKALDAFREKDIVRKAAVKIGSSTVSTPITSDRFEDYYIDDDGTISKSENLNKAFIELDKKNAGENFNEAHSDRLTSTLAMMASIVKGFQDKGVKLKKSTFSNVIEAEGHFDPSTDSIEVRLDTHGAGAEFRNNFSMTNQEVYVHEMIHAVMNFIMDTDNVEVAKDPKMQAMIGDLKALFKKAGKESTWKTLLPGIDEGVQYSDLQIDQAKKKWDYIFKNKNENGLHEFMAGIMTNEMFREGMEGLKTLDTKEVRDSASAIDKLHNWFMNLAKKIFGYATNKRDNSITKAGTTLIFDIMRANNNAVDKVVGAQAIAAVSDGFDKLQENIEIANESAKKMVAPFVGVVDALDKSIENKDKVLDKEGIAEFVKLNAKVQKLLKGVNDKATGNKLVVLLKNIYRTVDAIQRFLRALPAIYKMRQLTAGHPRSKSVAKHYARVTNKMLESLGLLRDGSVRGIARDFLDRPGMYNLLADSILKLTQKVDNAREKTYENVLAETNDDFGEIHINNNILNIRHNEALTDVVLRADIQSLGVDAKGLEELLRDPDEVTAKILELSEGLTDQQIDAADALANYMITGVGIASNAKNIAKGFGDVENADWTKEDIEQIDQLVSYKALELVEEETKQTMLDFMDGTNYINYSTTWANKAKKVAGFTGNKPLTKSQYIKQVESGINSFIDKAVGLQVASAEEMSGREHQIIKGYMKETFNTDYEVEYHPLSDKQQLINDGYTFVREVQKLPGSTVQYGMFISNSPAIKRTNGALGLQDRKHRGYTLRDMIANESANSTEAFDSGKRSDEFNKILKALKAKYKTNKDIGMQPIYNENGEIVNFRVTMSIADKKKYLSMETGGTHNLAKSYSGMGTATATTEHNVEVVDALYEDYLDNYEENKDEYVVIEPTPMMASDFGLEDVRAPGQTKYERMWARLPKDTKAYANKKFGSNKLVIKKELLTVAFGEDDFSLSQAKMFDKTSAKTKATINKIERVWQDTMQIAKGNIVIKTPEVLMGNVWSNFKILLYVGVHPVTGAKLMLTAAKELKRFEADTKELAKLHRDKKSGKEVNEVRMRELADDIKTNTVAPLIDAGLYQSIVEDVNTANDSNRVAQWFSDKTDKYITNETANSAVQLLFMTQRTKPYQQLLKATQVSDFYFRYAQYYAAIEKSNTALDSATTLEEAYTWVLKYTLPEFNNNLDMSETDLRKIKDDPAIRQAFKDKAMRDAIDNYINYEAPMEKLIRYGDSIGTWFFVKYFVRIQKVIKKFIKENPVRVGIDIALQQFVTGDTADVLDASVLDKGLNTYNPLKVFERFWEFVSPSGPEVIKNYLIK